MFRYFAVIWNHDDPSSSAQAQDLRRRIENGKAQWQRAYLTEGLCVYGRGMPDHATYHHKLADGGGVVIGTIFEQRTAPLDDTPARHARFNEAESKRIVETQGRRLVDSYWGDYIAFIVDKSRNMHCVLKGPTGSFPCLRVEHAGTHVFFSCIEDCLSLGLTGFTINWSRVEEYLVGGWFTAESGPLNEVDELTGGECLTLAFQANEPIRRRFHWNPCTFAGSCSVIEDDGIAAVALRQTVRHCVRTWSSIHKRILLRLSGGLDSSIVLGCLRLPTAEEDQDVVCLTYHGNNPVADCRPWARMAAAHAKVKHVEIPIAAADRRLEPLLDGKPTAAPTWRLSHFLTSSDECEAAETYGANAIFTGQGGDSNFGSLSIGAAIDEYLQRHGLGVKAYRLASQIAAYRDSTAARVLLTALRRRAFGTKFRDNAIMFEKIGQMVSPHLRGRISDKDRFPHPWFRNVPDTPWGLIYRLGTLLVGSETYDPFALSDASQPEPVSPLYSQPIVELCLSIPLYTHFQDGRDRGLARTAFAEEVPGRILQRQWKDRDENVNSLLIAKNLTFLRTLFREGALVREGYLCWPLLDRALSPAPTRDNFDISVILHYMHIEMWVRRWASSAQKLAA